MGSSTGPDVGMSESPLAARRRRVVTAGIRWHVPSGDDAALLTLLGLIVALENLIELPRSIFRNVLGPQLTSLLMTVVLSLSLVLLLFAAGREFPRWRWLYSRRVHVAVLVVTLLAVPTGIGQTAKMLAAGFQRPDYANDGTTLDHFAAQQLLWGHNPYAAVDIVSAVRFLQQDSAHTTPLGSGRFSKLYPTRLPDDAQRRAAFATLRPAPPDDISEFESHVSYPALSFLPLVPLVWAGFSSVVPFFVLCLFALVGLIALSAPPRLRPWIALLALADAPLLDATVAGALDVLYILLLFVAWQYFKRWRLSALALGLAVAAKQIAWFTIPFYVIWVARQYGWRQAVKRLAVAGAVFAATNVPFFLNDPHVYMAGILAPQVDRMFPQGNGLVGLSTGGLLPLFPPAIYSTLFLAAYASAIIWYWRQPMRTTALGFALAACPLFFAWRSLTTYFYFLALPALGLILAYQEHNNQLREGQSHNAELFASAAGRPEIS